MTIDGFIAYYPDFPVAASKQFMDWSETNPNYYEKTYGIPVVEGEPMQRMYVWTQGDEGCWSDLVRKKIGEAQFPNMIPLRLVMNGQEGKPLPLTIGGSSFTFECAMLKSKNADMGPFQSIAFDSIYRYPTNEEADRYKHVKLEPFYYHCYRYDNIASCPTTLIQRLYMQSLTYPRPEADHVRLKEIYKKVKTLGSGGEGVVFEVVRQDNGQRAALKITLKEEFHLPRGVLTALDHVHRQELTPHLTRVNGAYQIAMRVKGPVEWNNGNTADFYKEDPQAAIRTKLYAIEMELLDGDYESKWFTMTKAERTAIQIQALFTEGMLKKHGVSVMDNKIRNHFFKVLTAEDTFRGMRLIDFDYWKYTISGHSFFLPRPKEIMKLGDYDQWTFEAKKAFSDETPYLGVSGSELDEWAQSFPAPQSARARILDLGQV